MMFRLRQLPFSGLIVFELETNDVLMACCYMDTRSDAFNSNGILWSNVFLIANTLNNLSNDVAVAVVYESISEYTDIVPKCNKIDYTLIINSVDSTNVGCRLYVRTININTINNSSRITGDIIFWVETISDSFNNDIVMVINLEVSLDRRKLQIYFTISIIMNSSRNIQLDHLITHIISLWNLIIITQVLYELLQVKSDLWITSEIENNSILEWI